MFHGRVAAIALLLAACGEGRVAAPDAIDTATGMRRADVLFVVDDSCSMDEAQVALGLEAEALVAPLQRAGVDVQIGVLTTDVQSPSRGGRLVTGPDGAATVHAADPEAAHWLARTLHVGTSGAPRERGRDAALSVLDAGATRLGADVHLVFVSDEDDASETPVSELAARLPGRGAAHVLVTDGTCGDDGASYRALAAATGGRVGDLCDSSWSAFLAGVADDIVAADDGVATP